MPLNPVIPNNNLPLLPPNRDIIEYKAILNEMLENANLFQNNYSSMTEEQKNIFIKKQETFLFALENIAIELGKPIISEELKIGNQIWSAKNLNVCTFRNGDTIPEIQNREDWRRYALLREPAWSYYNNDPENGHRYGKLYNWGALIDERILTPEGWRLPNEEDWQILAGNIADNDFKCLYSGLRNSYGSFMGIGSESLWWSTKTSRVLQERYLSTFYWWMNKDSNQIRSGNLTINSGFAVRCIKE